MSIIPEYLNKYLDHPLRVKDLKDLKPGDWIVPIFDGRLSKPSYEQVHHDKIMRISSSVTSHGGYNHSFLVTGICMSDAGIPRTYGQYHWFGNYHIILRLPESQQKAYQALFDSFEHNNEAHKLNWSEWGRNRKD